MRRREMDRRLLLCLIGFSILAALIPGCLGPSDQGSTTTPAATTSTTLSPDTTTTEPPITSLPPTKAPVKETSTVTVIVTDTSGNPLNGIVAFEKGFVHKGRYLMGALVSNGRAEIELPKVRDIPEVEWNYWGMHVYATDHVYFPQEVEVIPGEDYVFEISLAPEPNPADDPVISSIEFVKGPTGVDIKVNISSSLNNLGPQNLALNSKTGEVLTLEPPTPVESLRDKYPNGLYTATYEDSGTDPGDWYFLAADHGCSNGPLQGYPVNENVIPALAGEKPALTTPPPGAESPVETGADLVLTSGCSGCHYFDRESRFEERDARTNWKIGPGLKGVLGKDVLPATGRPATPENIIKQIREGGGGMPPYPNLSDEEVTNIITYLESL